MKTSTKIITFLTLLLVITGSITFYVRYCFVFGEGVKAGELNRVVYKGYVFKTYEGYIVQSGFNSKSASRNAKAAAQTGQGIQSNEFMFSIKDKAIADSLMYHCGGKQVELHYKEYLGKLPWRGKEKFIVDRIVAVHD